MKQPFDWTQRIDSDAQWIEIIIQDAHKYGAGFHSNADFAKIRSILQGLVSDVQAHTREEMTNRVFTAQNEVK
jgi:hypothetical protein